MTNKYERIIKTALQNYSDHALRPGRPDGFFTNFRHSFCETKDITILKNAVENKTENIAKNLIEKRLANFPQNNHSFNAYLLDQLIENFPEENWETHNQRAIIYYDSANNKTAKHPYLYRGSFEKPDVVFNNGFKSNKTSTKIEDYADPRSLSIGLSTTKLKAVARNYATQVHGGRIKDAPLTVTYGYIYQIDPVGLPEKIAIDIISTWKIRSKLKISSFFSQFINDAKRKQEVNFIGSIPAQHITGYYSAESPNIFVNNANYTPVKKDAPQLKQKYENKSTNNA